MVAFATITESTGTKTSIPHGEFIFRLAAIDEDEPSKFVLQRLRMSLEEANNLRATARLRIGNGERAYDVADDLASTHGLDARSVLELINGRLKFRFTVAGVEQVDVYPDDVEDTDDAMEEYESSLIGVEHWEWTNNTMGPNSTLRAWLQGMLGRSITKQDNPQPEQFVGKDYKVQMGDKSYTIQQTGESGTKFTILTIKPYKAPRQRTRTPKTNEENLAPWEREDDE
jgi:hypothetical protein